MNRFWNWLAGLGPNAPPLLMADANTESMLERGRRLAVHLGVDYSASEGKVTRDTQWLGVVPILEKLTQRIEELERREPPEETE